MEMCVDLCFDGHALDKGGYWTVLKDGTLVKPIKWFTSHKDSPLGSSICDFSC